MDRHEGPYTCVELCVAGDRADIMSGVLWDHDPLGVEEEDRPGGVLLRGYFPPGADAGPVLEDLRELAGRDAVSVREVPREDWFRLFRESFRTFEAIPGVSVRPPWEPPPEAGLDLVIEPGAAFGTGLHETTRSAMELMEPLLGPGARVLDVGSGSGILAILARRRGASVVALEIDPEAIGNLVKNRELNGLAGQLGVVCGGPGALAGATFDVVAANVTLEIIAMLRDDLVRLSSPGGVVVMAGLLVERRAAALALAREIGRVEHESVRGEWLAMAVRRAAGA